MSSLDDDEKRRLYELEESLWKRETRFDEDYMDELLTENYFEFGRSGRTYDRETSVSLEDQKIDIDLPLENFEIHEVAEDVVLAFQRRHVVLGRPEHSKSPSK